MFFAIENYTTENVDVAIDSMVDLSSSLCAK